MWKTKIKKLDFAGRQWRTPVTLTTQEAEIRRIEFETSMGEELARPYLKNTHHKKVAQDIGPEFKPHTTHTRTRQLRFMLHSG
jgi:hypothetical protein